MKNLITKLFVVKESGDHYLYADQLYENFKDIIKEIKPNDRGEIDVNVNDTIILANKECRITKIHIKLIPDDTKTANYNIGLYVEIAGDSEVNRWEHQLKVNEEE